LTNEEEYEELQWKVEPLRAEDTSARREKNPAMTFPPWHIFQDNNGR